MSNRVPLLSNIGPLPAAGGASVCFSGESINTKINIYYFNASTVSSNDTNSVVESLFVDMHNRRWRHWSALPTIAFFPTPDDVVTISPYPDKYEIPLGCTPQCHDEYRICVKNGMDIIGKWPGGYNARGNIVNDNVRVSIRLGSIDPRAVRGAIPISYELPITRLLWRHGPAYEGKTIIPEAADYIMLEPAPAEWEGAPPSPVEVLLPDGSLATPEMFTVKALRKRGVVIPWAPSVAEERRRRAPRMPKAKVTSQAIRVGFTGVAAGEEPCSTAGANDLPNSQFPYIDFHLHTFGQLAQTVGAVQETDSDAMSWVGAPSAPPVRQLLGSPAGQAQMLVGHLH